MQSQNEPRLEAHEIQEQVHKRLEKYKKLNVSALPGWSVRRRWLRAATLLALAVPGGLALAKDWRTDQRKAAGHRLADQDTEWTRGFMPQGTSNLIRHYNFAQPEQQSPFPVHLLKCFAAEVDYREAGEISRERVAELHRVDCEQARAERRTIWNGQISTVFSPQEPGTPLRRVVVSLEHLRLTGPPPTFPEKPELGPLAMAANYEPKNHP